jgi:hypothetical protein
MPSRRATSIKPYQKSGEHLRAEGVGCKKETCSHVAEFVKADEARSVLETGEL